jgi:hypothetical protein
MQIPANKLPNQKKTPMKICLKIFRVEDLVLDEVEVGVDSEWDDKTVSEAAFKLIMGG